LPPELCDDIIQLYNYEKPCHYQGQLNCRYPGITHSGVNKNIKDTTDFTIPKNAEQGSKWGKINQVLYNELFENLQTYLNTLQNIPEFSSENNILEYKLFDINYFTEEVFMIQKYEKQKGKYIYHNDFSIEKNKYRVITYLWYLNDVEEGGETEVWYNTRIKPEKGKLLLFPSHWAVPHCGKMPISSDKIIITGWLYKNM
jgi:Rps23 Pro-64 3,4-dihydroxylase Tpa1-like proline 4-hydroxylase